MKPLFILPVRMRLWLTILGLAFNCIASVLAQPTVNLQASLAPVINISGNIGSLQEIQYTTNVADSNSWQTLTFVWLNQSPKTYVDLAASSQRFYRTRLATFGDTNLVWIPSGTFLMGSPDNEQGRDPDEGPQTQVTLTYGFFMSRFELRNFEMLQYVPTFTPSDKTQTNYLLLPARNLTWIQATNYCALRTAAELALGQIPAGWAYRLPTEAEWEYACRAGTTTPFSLGTSLRNDDIRHDACFNGNFPYPTNLVPVNPVAPNSPLLPGSFAPNAFGLYDVHGNVAEYCSDLFLTTIDNDNVPVGLPGGSITNPPPASVANPDSYPELYASLRGGASVAFNSGALCRSACRLAYAIHSALDVAGLRIVLAPVNP